ncbi:MAG: hypothetical protein ACLQFI_16830 [Methylocella sp.]
MKKAITIPKGIFHLQYPTVSAGRSILPSLLPSISGGSYGHIVTFHEFGAFNWLRKYAISSFALLPDAVVFTNGQEQGTFLRTYPFSRVRSEIIPIGSNIIPSAMRLTRTFEYECILFSQLRPRRGVEKFFEFATTLRQQGYGGKLGCFGAFVSGDESFERWVRDQAEAWGVDLRINESDSAISSLLWKSRSAYLPFLDGISEKRGSVLACLTHSVQILSPRTDASPAWLCNCSIDAQTPLEAAEHFLIMSRSGFPAYSASPELLSEIKCREWPEIARQHRALYERTLAGL